MVIVVARFMNHLATLSIRHVANMSVPVITIRTIEDLPEKQWQGSGKGYASWGRDFSNETLSVTGACESRGDSQAQCRQP